MTSGEFAVDRACQAPRPVTAPATVDLLFTPAMVAGRRVAQLVEQRFEFRLGGGG